MSISSIGSHAFSGFSRVVSNNGLVLGISVVALAAIAIPHYLQNQNGISQADKVDRREFEGVRARVAQAYNYVFGGLAIIGASATAAHLSGLSAAVLNSGFLLFGLAVATAATGIAAKVLPKDHDNKRTTWVFFNVITGAFLSPLGFLGQSVILQAAGFTALIGGGLTLLAHHAPDKAFLRWKGPLMTILATLTVASTVALFAPGTAFAYGVNQANVYGGILLFSAFMLYDTQKLFWFAERCDDEKFDPINASFEITQDIVQIFMRLAIAIAQNQRR